jgi:3-hydroxyisobutyrate dehydrogenase-like beta-hydroxyacid dehydrogenase
MSIVGFIGLGKLGFPVAVAIANRGHHVIGYDVDETRMTKNPSLQNERGFDGAAFDDMCHEADMSFASLDVIVKRLM